MRSKTSSFHNWKKMKLKFPNSMAHSHIIVNLFKLLDTNRIHVSELSDGKNTLYCRTS
jgi:hypothetical protein